MPPRHWCLQFRYALHDNTFRSRFDGIATERTNRSRTSHGVGVIGSEAQSRAGMAKKAGLLSGVNEAGGRASEVTYGRAYGLVRV